MDVVVSNDEMLENLVLDGAVDAVVDVGCFLEVEAGDCLFELIGG